jgi:hypothetical protein
MSAASILLTLGKAATMVAGADFGLRIVEEHVLPALPKPVQTLAGPPVSLGRMIGDVLLGRKKKGGPPAAQGRARGNARANQPAQRGAHERAASSARQKGRAAPGERPKRDLRSKVESQAAELDAAQQERDANAAQLEEMAAQLEAYQAAEKDAEQKSFLQDLASRVMSAAQRRPTTEEIEQGDPEFAEIFEDFTSAGPDDDDARAGAVARLAGALAGAAPCGECKAAGQTCDGHCHDKPSVGGWDDSEWDSSYDPLMSSAGQDAYDVFGYPAGASAAYVYDLDGAEDLEGAEPSFLGAVSILTVGGCPTGLCGLR